MSFRRYAKASGVDLTVLSFNALTKSAATHDFEVKPGFLYTRVRAISARVNRNFDGFPSVELKKAYKTFVGRPVFVNHENSDHRRTRGVIVSSQYIENGDDKYIELVNEIDAKAFPRLAKEILSGNIDSVSMGTDVTMSKCSYCGNEAKEMDEFCDHIMRHKGQFLVDDVGQKRLVYEACHGLNFFEISYVFDPADETAVMQEVIAPRTAIVTDPTLETIAPKEVDTLRGEEPCPNCGAEDYDGSLCQWCKHVSIPELEDPDTSKAKEHDDLKDKKRKEGKSMTTRSAANTNTDSSLDRALAARRRIREAQRRLADVPFDGTEEETIVGTPAPEAPVATTDQVRNQDATTDVQNLDQQVPTDLKADDTTDVTVKDPIADVPPSPEVNGHADDKMGDKVTARNSTMVTHAGYNEMLRDHQATQGANYKFLANQASGATETAHERGGAHDHAFAAKMHEWAGREAKDPFLKNHHRLMAGEHRNLAGGAHADKAVASVTAADDGTGGHDGNGAPNSDADAAKPDFSVDVTAPVADTNPEESQQSQYNTDEYDDNGGDNIKKVDPNNTNVNIGPGATQAKKASSLEVAMLVDEYVKHGLLDPKDKFNKWAEFESLSSETVRDRAALLSLVASTQPQRTAPSVPNKTVSSSMPRVARSAPVIGRSAPLTAALTREAELDQSDDFLTFLS